MKKIFLVFCVSIYFYTTAQTLDKSSVYQIAAIGFWNVENLYDTLNDPWKNDDDFTPEGVNKWTSDRYWTKIDHLATVISQIATDVTPDGLAILGLCEIENQSVVKDLIQSRPLKKRNYQFVHIEGPDARGVDPSFIYNATYFSPKKALAYRVRLVTDSTHKTRDILVISGNFCGESIAVLVNHWPSRRGGELLSRANRNAAAKIAKQIADSLLIENPLTKIVIMGDLNDDPVNESVKQGIGTFSDLKKPKEGLFFNPMEKLFKNGTGTLAWQDSWNLFDQILLNKLWIPDTYKTWQYYAVRIFNKDFLKTDYGNFKGYPFRTYSGGNYTAGYSDHFPSYVIVAKKKAP